MSDERAMDAAYGLVWTNSATQETVPAAFAIGSRWLGDPWRAWLEAAGLGGASDTVGTCCWRGRLPGRAARKVARVNGLDLESVAEMLLRLRARTADWRGAKEA
jgi:ADP-ribosylglycohydrolase